MMIVIMIDDGLMMIHDHWCSHGIRFMTIFTEWLRQFSSHGFTMVKSLTFESRRTKGSSMVISEGENDDELEIFS